MALPANPPLKNKVPDQATARQYAELTEDELIELASELGSQVYASGTAGEGRKAALEMVAVVEALNERRKATADARRRVGEYLRHYGILEQQYRDEVAKQEKAKAEGRKVYGNPKPPQDTFEPIRADEYTGPVTLRVSDLQRLVPPVVRDTKMEFEMAQQVILGMWDGSKLLTEKQAALLPCIAAGHITSYSSGSYGGERGCTCARPDGRTVFALIRKGVVGSRSKLGWNSGSMLMLKRPAE